MDFHLAAHVHACATGGQLVLLDVRRDEYMGLGPAQARALGTRVQGWPDVGELPNGRTLLSVQDVERLVEGLRALKMIEVGPVSARAHGPNVPTAQVALVSERPGVRPRLQTWAAASLIQASVKAAWMLRARSLESILDRVTRRKAARARDSAMGSAPVADWVSAFIAVRPMLFGAQGKCLFESFVLIESLAARNVFPTWVFGVKVAPFAAHCWLQDGATVYNDLPEHVRGYTPILSI